MLKMGVGFLVVLLCLAALPAQPAPCADGVMSLERSVGQGFAPVAATDRSFPQQAILRASDAQSNDSFGFAVAISGDTAVVGAYEEDGGPGDPVVDAGAAYVFQRPGATGPWRQVARLTATVPQVGAAFGLSVAISGSTVIVGAPFEDGGGGTVSFSGAAYLFGRNVGGTEKWGGLKRLTAPDAQAFDEFGYSVSISGSTGIVGARYEEGGEGDPENGSGAAYVFEKIDTFPWLYVATLRASDVGSNDNFGSAVAIHGDVATVGAPGEDGGPDNLLQSAGAIYIFDRDQGGTNRWGEIKKFNAYDRQANDQLGSAVAISGDTVIAGARLEDGGPTDPLPEAGAAYVFQHIQGFGWFEIKKLTASDAQTKEEFGGAVTILGDTAIVGARYDDGGFPNGLGAAYVFIRHLNGTNKWGQAKKLTASDAQAGDWFGAAVSLSGSSAIVGAFEEDGGPGDPHNGAGAAYQFRMGFLGFFHAESLPLAPESARLHLASFGGEGQF